MRLIHHKLENGLEDPIDIELKSCAELLHYTEGAVSFGDFRPSNGYEKEPHPSKVFLLTHGDDACASNGEVYVSNNPYHILYTLDRWTDAPSDMDTSIIHLQEFDSFESAYAVALAMREGHPLCYSE